MSAIRLAFSGKMRSGKDTAADFVVNQLKSEGWHVERLAFADALRDIRGYAQRVCGFPEGKDRVFEQWAGTEWARNIDPDVWAKVLERKLMDPDVMASAVVVTDLRFPNEFKMLRRMGFTLVRVCASQQLRLARGAEPSALHHASETGLDAFEQRDLFDWTILNEGSIDELHAECDSLLTYAWRKTAMDSL